MATFVRPAHPWPTEALWQALQAEWPGITVEVAAELDSTNETLLTRARAGDRSACLLVAEHQRQGRGRQGRRWISAPGDSLTFSVGVPYAPRQWAGLSLAVGVAVAEALAPEVQIKWPNDLWCAGRGPAGEGRKLGGILIETVGTAPSTRQAVVGIGLNVRSPDGGPAGWPDPRNRPAGLEALLPGIDAAEVLRRVAPAVVRALREFEREGFPAFRARFEARDLLRGHTVQTTEPEAPEGVALGVDDEGALLVHTAAGVRTVAVGEVSVRPC